MNEQLLFEKTTPGRTGYVLPALDVPETTLEDAFEPHMLRGRAAELPELSEPEIIRHYTLLSHRNHAIDLGFYPLGSCTMKYNPKVNDRVAELFAGSHPYQPAETVQGTLEVLHRTMGALCEITGMADGTLQPYAGAHGEFTGMKLFKAYFKSRGEEKRRVVLVPDSAHGTNPASAHIAGFEVVEIPSNEEGIVDMESVRPHLNDELAGIMLTNPNTLGLFERHVVELASAIHEAGGLLYYDGANLNAVLGTARPGDMGFDVVHLNLHKTFSTPHGGGGPGAGPVLVCDELRDLLPSPRIFRRDGRYALESGASPHAVGRIAGFYGNVGVVVRAFAYILSMGRDGLRHASRMAVLNANYLKECLKELIDLPFDSMCKHEFVLSAKRFKDEFGVSAMDIAKRLLDFGVHAPTVYFPLNVPEALMIEPTETESLAVLERFVEIVGELRGEIESNPAALHAAPTTTPIRRVDDVRAARHPVLTFQPEDTERQE